LTLHGSNTVKVVRDIVFNIEEFLPSDMSTLC